MTYLTYTQIKEKLIEDLKTDQEEIDQLLSYGDHELLRLNFTLGRQIRKTFDLWEEDNPLTNLYKLNPERHPEVVSLSILKSLWDHFKNN